MEVSSDFKKEEKIGRLMDRGLFRKREERKREKRLNVCEWLGGI